MVAVSETVSRTKLIRGAVMVAILAPIALLAACAPQPQPQPAVMVQPAPMAPPPPPPMVPRARG